MAWIYQPATPGSTADTSTPIEWKGTFNDYNGVTFEMHPAECGEAGCSSCCSNAMMCMLTWGTCVCVAPRFTIQINEDGKTGVGKDSKIMGCLPMSPIPCFNGCGFGPCAFVSPFRIEDLGNGQGKWVGNGQVVAGGCCPCMNNIGDYGINNAMLDGSAPEKAHNFYAVSLFWPPCLNGQCCGKGKPAMRMTQLGVGKPVLAASSGDGAPAATEITDRENPATKEISDGGKMLNLGSSGAKVVVTGAGSAQLNGTYNDIEVENKKQIDRELKHESGFTLSYWAMEGYPKGWFLTLDGSKAFAGAYYNSRGDKDSLPTAGWEVYTGQASAPGDLPVPSFSI